jgi:hypothetical protein
LIAIGKWNPQDFLNYLTVQQQLATAIATEYQVIANYNNALATFEFAKGTIKQYNNVTMGEGPLPAWAQKKAADHIRERTDALKLREWDVSQQGHNGPTNVGNTLVGPAVGTGFTEELPPFANTPSAPIPKAGSESPPNPMNPPVPPPGMGVRPWPSPPTTPFSPSQMQTGNLSQTAVPGMPVSPLQTQPSPGAASVVGSGDYFRPVGTLDLGIRGSSGTLPPAIPPISSPEPLPQFPAGTGMNPMPIPLVSTMLPTPPPLSGAVEFGAPGSLPPFGVRP